MDRIKTNIKRHYTNSRLWINSHKKEFYILLFILLIASFTRLYRIDEYMTFLGDEGRDVILVRRFLMYGDIMLIGPGTSIGNMYLGPLYYYFMAPALLLAGYSPVGPAVLVALLGIATVWLIWFTAREWFGRAAGMVAALLYALSPTVIIYSRSSWNPNIMPFFALLCMYGIWRVWKHKEYAWLPVVGVSLAGAMQSHYLALLIVPSIGIIWLLSTVSAIRSHSLNKRYIAMNLLALLSFIVLMSPLVIFDARHGWRNFNAIKVFFTERQTTVSIRPWNALPQLWPQLSKVSTRLVGGYDMRVGQWVAIGIVATVFIALTKRKFFKTANGPSALFLLSIWFGVSLAGLALYKQEVYDHYYGFFFPVPFLIIGALIGTIIDRYKIRGAWLGGTALVFLIWASLMASPLRYSPNRQLTRSVSVTDFIREKANGTPFNFAVIAERNYEGAYRYFFDQKNDPVYDINAQDTQGSITSQLFVVCEMERLKCDPTHNAKTEIANFGWTEIEEEWEVFGTTVFKLVHSQLQ